ncbi:MAG: hypothetical protein M9883_21200 [Methylobacteriaceae bacterium]|nr:hypothetical protein [Methylobacteriaceae bacterium]
MLSGEYQRTGAFGASARRSLKNRWNFGVPLKGDQTPCWKNGMKAAGWTQGWGEGILVWLQRNNALNIERRKILAGLGACLCAPLGGCGGEYVDFSSLDAIAVSASSLAKQSDGQGPGRGVMFARALYRASTPPEAALLADDFDPKTILRVASDRGIEPEFFNRAYCEAVMAAGGKLAGLGVRSIVEIYVTGDLKELNRQDEWAKGFDARVKRRLATMAFDEQRRKGIVDRVTPRKAGYRWTSGSQRIPVIDVELFNPIDRPLTGAEFAVDLLDRGGRVVASGVFLVEPPVALQPGAFGQYAIDVSKDAGFNNPGYRDLKDPVRVSMKVRDVFVDDHVSVLQARDDSKNDDARRISIGRLRSEIVDARNNLAKYRAAFL